MAVAIATTNFKINMTTDFFIGQRYFQTNHAKHDEDERQELEKKQHLIH